MAAAVVPSSRDTLDWAAQQDTPILNVDDVEAGPDSVEINPQVYVALAELLEGEALDIVQNKHNTRRRFGSLAETREKV